MTRLARAGRAIDDPIVHGSAPGELQPWLGVIVEANAALDALLPRVREPGVLVEVAQLGLRRRDLMDALATMAADSSLAEGDFEVLWRHLQDRSEREAPTRALVIATAASLGLGPDDRERFAHAATTLRSSALCDWASVLLRSEQAHEAALRLSERLGVSQDYDEVALAALALASEGRSARLRVRRRLMLRFPALAQALTDDALPVVRGAGVPNLSAARAVRDLLTMTRARPSDPHAAITDIDRRIRPDRSARYAYSTDLLIGASIDEIDDAIVAAAPTLTLAELRLTLDWAFDAQQAVFDALCEAPSVSSDAIDFVEDFARSRSLRPDVCRTFIQARWREHRVLAAAIDVLVRHAPERWRAFLEERADSLDPRRRAEVARLVDRGDGAGAELLERLEVDPFRSVRDAAGRAWRELALRHAMRQRTRWALWAALSDTDEAYAVVREGLGPRRPFLDYRAWWRGRRAIERLPLSARAREWLDEAATSVAWGVQIQDVIHRRPVRAASPRSDEPAPLREGEPLGARLTATDGRSMRIDLLRVRTDTRRYALSEAVVATFVASAPSRYMRLTLSDGSSYPVRVVLDAKDRIVLEDADPRILEHIPA